MQRHSISHHGRLCLALAGVFVAVAGLAGEPVSSGPQAAPTNAAAAPAVVTIQPGLEGPAAAAVKKMESIIIPKLEFQQANLVDVIEFLNKVSMAGEDKARRGQNRSLNFVLNLAGRPSPAISFTARGISLMTALNVITQLAGMRYRIEDNVVMIVPRESEAP